MLHWVTESVLVWGLSVYNTKVPLMSSLRGNICIMSTRGAFILGPRWTESSLNTIVGEDHLGIRSVAIAMAERLQSGITSITPRARYYSFFAWVLHDFIQTQSDKSVTNFKRFLKRQEWYYILANLAEAAHAEYTPTGVVGITKGTEIWNKGLAEFPVYENYLKNAFGGYNVYRNVMKLLGITVVGDANLGVQIDRLTESGQELAEAFQHTVAHTKYFTDWRHKENAEVPASVLLEFGQVAGLSRLSQPASQDRELLERLFTSDSTDDEYKQLRSQSLAYYRYIVKRMNGQPLNQVAWRRCMYNYSYGNQERVGFGQVPSQYHDAALGWEIFQGRQLLTYSLESMWCYVLDVMSRRPYATEHLISEVLSALEQRGISIEDPVEDVIRDALPLPMEVRDDYVLGITSEDPSVADRVWNPLLVMLDVALHFSDRSRFRELHHEFLRMGERGHISLSTFEFDLYRYMDKPVSQYLEFLIRYYILEQHQHVALNKILGTGNDTYHFVENDGKLDFLHPDYPVFNAFRVGQAMSVLKDLGFLKESQNAWMTTGREVQLS